MRVWPLKEFCLAREIILRGKLFFQNTVYRDSKLKSTLSTQIRRERSKKLPYAANSLAARPLQGRYEPRGPGPEQIFCTFLRGNKRRNDCISCLKYGSRQMIRFAVQEKSLRTLRAVEFSLGRAGLSFPVMLYPSCFLAFAPLYYRLYYK